MPMNFSRLCGILLLGWLVLAAPAPAAQTASASLSADEKLELDIFRMRAAELAQQGKREGLAGPVSEQLGKARDDFRIAQYHTQARMQEVRVRVFEWQIFAANTVLSLVALLAVAGIAFAGYQLWLSSRIAASAAGSIELEVSSQKVRLQTSVVGLAVLVISGLFLLLFLRDVYRIEVVDLVSPPAKAAAPGK